MQIICVGHPNVGRITGGFQCSFAPKEVYPSSLVRGDTPEDAYGTSIYGSVIKDGSVYRMWYQAWDADWDQRDVCRVACIESDDGINWRKPKHGALEYHNSKNNHLTDLPFHCPSVFINPHADLNSRYVAFGYVNVHTMNAEYRFHGAKQSGYYIAHSGDGIHWRLGSDLPVWHYADVITSVWDQYADCARIFLKKAVVVGNFGRRSVFEGTWKDGAATEERAILIPDEYDDINAHALGFQSADYYGMGTMPTKGATVGFLWNFRHMPPLSAEYGAKGRVDLSLVFQGKRGDKWSHIYGRPNWLSQEEVPEWGKGAMYTASSPLDVGDETWLYFSATRDRHGWTGYDRGYLEYLDRLKGDGGFAQIGVIKWQKDRLFGYSTTLRDRIELHPNIEGFTGKLTLNTKTQANGSVRVCVMGEDFKAIEGYTFDDCDSFSGDNPNRIVSWRGIQDLPLPQNQRIFVDVEIEQGTIFGFDFI